MGTHQANFNGFEFTCDVVCGIFNWYTGFVLDFK